MARIEVVGNAGSDFESKQINGQMGSFVVGNFSLAETPRERKGDTWVDGETIWYRVSITGAKADNYIGVVQKGKRYLVVGTLKPYSYQAKDGTTKSGLEIRAENIAEIPTKPKKAQAYAEDSWGAAWNS